MPRRLPWSLLFLCALLLSAFVALPGARAVPAEKMHLSLSLSPLEDVLTCTRTDRWLEGVGLSLGLTTQLNHQLSRVRRDLTLPVFRVVQRDFSGAALSARFRAILATRSEPEQLTGVLAFYRSPLGERYARADQQVRVADVREFLREHPLTPARRGLLEQWIEASRAMDRYAAVVVAPATLLERALRAFDPRLAGHSERELAAPMHSAEVKNSVVEHSAAALSEFSAEDLAAITRFEASPAGRAYRGVEMDAVRQTLEEAFSQLTNELASLGQHAL
jgi:hypothetical protein